MKAFRKFHSLFGIISCWFLFLICFFGSCAYFKDEINYYMQPNLSSAKELNLKNAVDYLNKNYSNYEVLSIKTEPYFSNFYELGYFNLSSSKQEKKQNIIYFNNEEVAKTSTMGSKFLVGIHYKLLPSFSSLSSIFKAFISILAAIMLFLLISGFFIWNKKGFNEIKNKNEFLKLYDFHIVSGIFLVIFLGFLSFSGIGLNYLKDIEKFFSSTNQTKQIKNAGVKNNIKNNIKNNLYTFDTEVILKSYEDAKNRLNTDYLNITLNKVSKKISITPAKNEKPLDSITIKNSHLLVYSDTAEFDEKLSIKAGIKELKLFESIYEIFFTFHRAHFAPFIVNLMFGLCGVIACIFIYKAMILFAKKRKDDLRFKALANSVLYPCVNATLIYFLSNKILFLQNTSNAAYEQNAFYIGFIISFILSFIFTKKEYVLKLISASIFTLLILVDLFFMKLDLLTLVFDCIFTLCVLLCLRRKDVGFNN